MKAMPNKSKHSGQHDSNTHASQGGKAGIVDTRPASAELSQLQEIMQHSPQATQLAAMQEKMARQPKPTPRQQTGLPTNLKAGIEALSGISMDQVQVHYNSDKPAQLHAHAYAQGVDIHLAPGQEKHLPHEAWHVVQQAQGRVSATRQLKAGVAVNDDLGLESEADAMGARAARFAVSLGTGAQLERGASSQHTLSPMNDKRLPVRQGRVIQRFYAVIDVLNTGAEPNAEIGWIDELELGWINLPDPRDESEYPITVEGTGWYAFELYARSNYTESPRISREEYDFLYLKQLKNWRSTPYKASKFSHPPDNQQNNLQNSTGLEKLTKIAKAMPVPTYLADTIAHHGQKKIRGITPKNPIQQGLESYFSGRVEVIKGNIVENSVDSEKMIEMLKWVIYLSEYGSDDSDEMLTIIVSKLSPDEAKEVTETIDQLKLSELLKMYSKGATGLLIGQVIGKYKHPAARLGRIGLNLLSLFTLYNDFQKMSMKFSAMRSKFVKTYKLVVNHRDCKIASKMQEVSFFMRMFWVHNPFE